MKAVDVAYAAGFFDGEGHVSCRLNTSGNINLQVSVCQKDRQPLDWFLVLFGGHIYRMHNKHSGAWNWVVAGQQAYRFLDVVLPFLMVKQADAKEAIERWLNR